MDLQQKAQHWAYQNGLGPLVDATRAARERTGINIGTQVQGGLIRVVRTEYGKRKTTVTPLSTWIEIDRAIQFIASL
jgi:hypothetical protein